MAGLGCAFLLALQLGSPAHAQQQQTNAGKPASNRGVAALGRIEPLGGIVRVAAASTPDAVSGAVLAKLLVDRGSDVTAG
ncbi:MAG TPA: hypothetical protein VFP48_09150, partial [Steroidobacteraceae bacterium]|nr:hypothetical protein [Steroidobacteraceae bacterium]